MANTFTQIHIHIVMVVENRASIISANWEDELYKYLTGIITKQGHKLLAINGMSDHIHLLVGMKPVQSVADLVRILKCNNTNWINDKKYALGKFAWQKGYAAFSYSKSQVKPVIKYISNQKQHHGMTSFREEYEKMLRAFEVEYEDKYIFHEVQ